MKIVFQFLHCKKEISTFKFSRDCFQNQTLYCGVAKRLMLFHSNVRVFTEELIDFVVRYLGIRTQVIVDSVDLELFCLQFLPI